MGKEQDLLDASRSGQLPIVDKILCGRIKKGGPLQLTSLRRLPGPNTSDPRNGFTCLHYASLNGHKEIVRLLLEHGANPNIVDHNGSSPLHLASWTGDYEIVDMLSVNPGQKAEINLKNKDNETALHSASQYGHTAVVSLLLTQGADPFIRNVRHESALDLAAQYGRLETIELLLGMRFDLLNEFMLVDRRALNPLGSNMLAPHSPLHLASRNGHKSIVKLLVDMGFDVDFLTQNGTALHEAVLCGKVEVVRMLLEAGSDIYLENEKGQKVEELLNGLNTSVAKQTKQLIHEHMQSIAHSNRSHLVSPLSESTTLANSSFCDQEDLTLVDSMLNEDIALYNHEFEEMMLDEDGEANVQCISPPPGYSDLAPEQLQHLGHHLDNLEGAVSPSSSLFSASIFSELASIFDEHLNRTSADESNEDLAKLIKPSTSFTLSDFNHHRNPQYDSDYHDSTTDRVHHHQSFDAVYSQDNSHLLMSSSLHFNSRFGENEFGELKPKYPHSATSNCDMMQSSNYSLSSAASSIPGDAPQAQARSDGSNPNLLDQQSNNNKPRPPNKPPRKSIDNHHQHRNASNLIDQKHSKTRSSIDCTRNADLARSDFNVNYEPHQSSLSVDVSSSMQTAESITDLLDSDHSNSQHLSSVIAISKVNVKDRKNRKKDSNNGKCAKSSESNEINNNNDISDATNAVPKSGPIATTLTQSIDDFYMLYDQVAKSEYRTPIHHPPGRQSPSTRLFSGTKHSSLDLLEQRDANQCNYGSSSNTQPPSQSLSVSSSSTATITTTVTITSVAAEAAASSPLAGTHPSINSTLICSSQQDATAPSPSPGTEAIGAAEFDQKPPPSPSKAENVIFTAIEPLKQEKRRKRKKRNSASGSGANGGESIKFGGPSMPSISSMTNYNGANSNSNHQQCQYLNKRDNWTLTDDDDFRLANVVTNASANGAGFTTEGNYDFGANNIREINHKSVAVSTDELEPAKINDSQRGGRSKPANNRRNQPQNSRRKVARSSNPQSGQDHEQDDRNRQIMNNDPNNTTAANATTTEKSDYFSVYCETLKFDRKGEKGNPFAGLCRGGLTPIKTASNVNISGSKLHLNGNNNNKMTSSSSLSNNGGHQNKSKKTVELSETRKSLRRQRSILGGRAESLTKLSKLSIFSEPNNNNPNNKCSDSQSVDGYGSYGYDGGASSPSGGVATSFVAGHGHNIYATLRKNKKKSKSLNGDCVMSISQFNDQPDSKQNQTFLGTSSQELSGSVSQRLNSNSAVPGESANRINRAHNHPQKQQQQPESTSEQNIEQLNQWLKKILMPQYLNLLVSNGYDNLQFMDTNVMDDCDLLEIGIINAAHRDTILKAVSVGQSPPPPIFKLNKSHLNTLTVGDWLALLDLSQYEQMFHKNQITELRKVRTIWEVELETMFEMDKIGHRRRIMYSLRDLSRESILIDDDGLSSWLTDTSTGTGNGHEPYVGTKSVEPKPAPDTESVSGETIGTWKGWKHARQELVNGSCHYAVCYLGSTLVRELRGIDSTRASIGKMKLIVQDKKTRVPKILLVISCKGVQFKDSISATLICEHEIRNIHCICQDSEDLNYFAYITKDFESNNHYCHVFMSQQTDLVTEIILTLGQAFEIAYQIVLEQYNIHATNYIASQQQQQQQKELKEHQRHSTGDDQFKNIKEIGSRQIMRPADQIMIEGIANSETNAKAAEPIELESEQTNGNGSNYSTYVKSSDRSHYSHRSVLPTNQTNIDNKPCNKGINHDSANVSRQAETKLLRDEEQTAAVAEEKATSAINGKKVNATVPLDSAVLVNANDSLNRTSVKVINDHSHLNRQTKIYAKSAMEHQQPLTNPPQIEELYAVVDKSKKANRIHNSSNQRKNSIPEQPSTPDLPQTSQESEQKPRPPRRSSSTSTTPTSTAQRPEIKPKPPIRVTSIQSSCSSSGTMAGTGIKPEVSPKPKNLLSKSHTTAGHISSNHKPAIPAKPSLGPGSGYSSSNCSSPQPPQ